MLKEFVLISFMKPGVRKTLSKSKIIKFYHVYKKKFAMPRLKHQELVGKLTSWKTTTEKHIENFLCIVWFIFIFTSRAAAAPSSSYPSVYAICTVHIIALTFICITEYSKSFSYSCGKNIIRYLTRKMTVKKAAQNQAVKST